MASTSVRIPVELDLSRAEKALKKGIGDKVVRIKLDPKDFNQPLGRITGKLGEFDNALAASNARVIAFGASASAIYAIQRALTATVKSAIEVEKVLADINVILNASGSNLQKFGDQLFKIAGNTGQSFNEVAKAATELARQGLSVSETLRRTNDALVLTRLSGLGAAQSVESLTAAINSFNKTAITSTEIVNKLANVDAAFAVSSKDLAEAIRRVGSTANDANVSFDELIAAVTSAQQVTARGGAVIGNSFKTIFTRLQRPRVLDALEKLGVQTRSISGDTRPAIKILKDFAKTYESLAPSIKATTSELIGGVFQINIVKAALADLNKEYSIFDQALKTSVGSTDEAIKRNEALNETMSAMINKTFANLQKVAAGAGEDMFGPMMKKLIGGLNSALESLGEDPDTKGVGSKIASGIFKGIGDFLSGPGLIIGAVGLFKIVSRISATASDALQSIVLTSKAQEKVRNIKMAAFNVLQKEPGLLEQVLAGTKTIEQAHEQVLNTIEAETNALRLQMNLAGELAKKLSAAGVTIPEAGPFAGTMTSPRGGSKKAGGYKPDWLGETSAMSQSGYSLSDMRDPGVRSQKIHDGKGRSFMASVNKHETVETVKGPGGKKGTFVIPPQDSDAFRNLKAGGFTPNFAKKAGPSLGFTRKGSIYDMFGTVEDILGLYGSHQGINSNFFKQMQMMYDGNLEKDDLVKMKTKVGGISHSRSPEHLEELARKHTGSYDPAAKLLGRGKQIKGAKGGTITTPSLWTEEAKFYATDLGSGKYKGFQFSRGDAKRKAGMELQSNFYKSTIGKNLRASLMEMDSKIQPGKKTGFSEGVQTRRDTAILKNYFLAARPEDKIPMSMDASRKGTKAKNPTLKHGLVSSLMGQGRKKAKGFIPHFATGIYDSDYIPGSRTGKQAILDAITGSGKPIKTIMGASGSGKSTFSAGMGKRITSMNQVGKFNDFVIVYGGGKSSKGGLTAQGKQVFGATTGGVTAVAPSNQEIYSRRIGRLNKARHSGMPDERSYKGLMGAMKAPYNQYDYMAQVKKMMKGRGQSFNVARAGGFIPNFAGSSEALSIFNTKGKQVSAGRAAHDWREMSSSDFKKTYGSKHAGEREAAATAGIPYSKWKQGKDRSSRQAAIKRINSPHVMLTSDIGLKRSSMTVDKKVNDKKYKVTFPYGGLRKSPIGASNFKDLIDQELSGGMTNIYNRLGFKDLESSLGSKQRPEFSKVMRQSNVDQTLGNMFDGLVKKMIRGSSKLIDDDKASVAWDVPSTSGSIEKAFHTKGGLKGDLKLSAGKEGPSDFAEKVLSDKGIKRTKPKAGGFFPSFAKGIQKAVLAEQMFGGKNARPVLDFSDELQSKGMSGLYVRDKKQKNIDGVKKDHGGLSRALRDAKGMQKGMAKGFIPNFAKDDITDDMGGKGARWMMASFMAPMIAQTVGELVPATKGVATALGQGASMLGTIFSMMPNPWGLAIGGVVGISTAASSLSKSIKSKREEFDLAAGKANENLTEFQNGVQGYLSSLEAFNNATKDGEREAAEIARIHANMAESLSAIDSEYQVQLLAAKDIADAQKIAARLTKQMTKDAGQVKFAAELQKTMDDMRDAFSFTEIFDKKGNLGKVTSGLVKSIGTQALAETDNIDQILSGTQDEIVRKLTAEFDIDPLLAQSLRDLTDGAFSATNEFAALMDELKASKLIIDDTAKILKKTKELQEERNKKIKSFEEAVKSADERFVAFTNGLRESGETLMKVLQGTMDLRAGAKAGIRQGAFERGKSGLNIAKGTISSDAFAERMSFLNAAQRRGKVAGSAGKAMRGSMKEQMSAISKAFKATLDEADIKDKSEKGRQINKQNAERQAKFALQMGNVAAAMQNMDPVADRSAMQNMVNGLAASVQSEDKQAGLIATLNGIQADAGMKLAKIEQDANIANATANNQLKEQKEANRMAQRASRLGGIKGFMDPTSTLKPMFDQFNLGLSLMRSGGKIGGSLGTVARGRGAMNLAMSGRDLGIFDEGGAASKALRDMAVPAHMKQQQNLLRGVRGRLMGERRGMLARGDRQGAAALGAGISEIGQKLSPAELKATAERQIDLELKTGDLKKVNHGLMEAVKELTATFKGQELTNVLSGELTAALDGSTLNQALFQNAVFSNGIIESNKSLETANTALGEKQKELGTKFEKALTNFKNELTIGNIPKVRESLLTGAGTAEFLTRNDSRTDWQPSQKAFVSQIERITTKLAQLDEPIQVDSLVDMQTKAKDAGISMSEFITHLDASTRSLDYFIKGTSAAAMPSTGNAGGYVPNFNKVMGYGAERERRMAAMGGYAAGGVTSMMIGGKKRIYNRAEQVKQFPGMEPAIMPPSGSRAGRNYRSRFGKAHGFNPYAAKGYVPNFARKSMSWQSFWPEGKGLPPARVYDMMSDSPHPMGGGGAAGGGGGEPLSRWAKFGQSRMNPLTWKSRGGAQWRKFVDSSKRGWGRRGELGKMASRGGGALARGVGLAGGYLRHPSALFAGSGGFDPDIGKSPQLRALERNFAPIPRTLALNPTVGIGAPMSPYGISGVGTFSGADIVRNEPAPRGRFHGKDVRARLRRMQEYQRRTVRRANRARIGKNMDDFSGRLNQHGRLANEMWKGRMRAGNISGGAWQPHELAPTRGGSNIFNTRAGQGLTGPYGPQQPLPKVQSRLGMYGRHMGRNVTRGIRGLVERQHQSALAGRGRPSLLSRMGGWKGIGKGTLKFGAKGVGVGVFDYAGQKALDHYGVDEYSRARLAPGMIGGLAFGGPAGMALAAGFKMTEMTAENIDYSASVADQIGNESARAAANRAKGSANQKKLRALGQAKQNIIDQLNQRGMSIDSFGQIGRQGVSQGGIFDLFKGGGSDKNVLARQYKQIVEQQAALSRSMDKGGSRSKPGYATDPKVRAAFEKQARMTSIRRMMIRRSRKPRMSDDQYWSSMDRKEAERKKRASFLTGAMTAKEYRENQPKAKPPRVFKPGEIAGGRGNISWAGEGLHENMLRDSARLKRQGYANGYVPNFQGINDAIGREIRDGGVSPSQVRVHMNPDFVTNTRDEPNGKIPNFANSEGIKQMLSILKELLQETREKNQEGSAKERREQETEVSEGTVNHKHSPLNINVSGSIQETNSNIDQEIFAAVVKAVEKLRGGLPVAPPKAEAGV